MYLQMLAYLLFFQSFVACQSVQEKAAPLEFDLSFQSLTDFLQESEKTNLTTNNFVIQSIDGGQTWQDVSTGLPEDLSVEYFLVQKGEVILGAEHELYRSMGTFTAPVWEKELLMEQFSNVFPSLNGLYAWSTQNGFFKSISKGIWMPVFADLKSQYFRTLMETRDGTLFIGTDNGILKSIDQGKTWKQVHKDGWVINMVESEGVLICTNQRGILRSTDQGEHWDLVISEGGVGIAVEVIQGGFAAITYNTESKTRRVRISVDGGKTWQPIDAGLRPDANIASIKEVGEYFFCGHTDGIYRSSDRGKTWQLRLCSINKKVYNLVVSGQVIYAVPMDGGC